MFGSCFFSAGRGHRELRHRINHEAEGSSYISDDQESNSKRPKTKCEPKEEETELMYATRDSIRAGRHMHTGEEVYTSSARSRSARSTMKEESGQSEDESPGRKSVAWNVVSGGPITRPCLPGAESSTGAGERAGTGGPDCLSTGVEGAPIT